MEERNMTDHTRDERCDVDPDTFECRGCHVLHGDPCFDCGGRGFHKLTIDEETGEPIRMETCPLLYAELMECFRDGLQKYGT
jgi:hypothetical protein